MPTISALTTTLLSCIQECSLLRVSFSQLDGVRPLANWVEVRISERRACRLLKLGRYKSTKDEQAPLRMRLRELDATRVRFGYRRIHILLRREGWPSMESESTTFTERNSRVYEPGHRGGESVTRL